MPVGHGADGKASRSHALLAAGLALKAFVALTYDPLGQGERQQSAGGPTAQHTYANGQMMLIGENVARYRIWDAIRGLAYLVSRPDVDPERLGCTGCSGGGTVTTYVAALDDRVRVAAPACSITTWQELLTKLGPQDGEQSFPGFLKEGLNMGDYVALFAPKPYLIVSTTEDFYSIAGAREVYQEAKRFYRLYGAEERIGHQIGPGGHGVPQVNREGIYAWFQRWLGKPGDPKEPPIQVDSPETLRCTPSSASLPSRCPVAPGEASAPAGPG
jgi:hypothetical protein